MCIIVIVVTDYKVDANGFECVCVHVCESVIVSVGMPTLLICHSGADAMDVLVFRLYSSQIRFR